MRYLGGVISSTAPSLSTTRASGIFNIKQHSQQVSANAFPAPTISIKFLMVAGGGSSGGGWDSVPGAGGAGGLLYAQSLQITPGRTYSIFIGSGGANNVDYEACNGTNSEAFGCIALGGGAGAVGVRYRARAGKDGGCGGGGGGWEASPPFGYGVQADSNGATGFGHNGHRYAGGGTAEPGGTDGGQSGGDGKFFAEFNDVGHNGYFGGGGVGYPYATANASYIPPANGGGGGSGIGGEPRDGLANTGGGGGSPGNYKYNKGKGGSGVAIVKYDADFGSATITGGGILSTADGFHRYVFNSSGTIKIR